VYARAFAVDGSGNVYTATNGAVIVLSSTGTVLSSNSICNLPAMVRRDSAGNYLCFGPFDGTNNFGGVTLVGGWIDTLEYPPRWKSGTPTCFLAKYTSTGSLLWVNGFGTQGVINYACDIQMNADDSIIVGYSAYGDPTLCRYSSGGTNLWVCDVGQANQMFKTTVSFKITGLSGTNGFLTTTMGVEYSGSYDASGNFSTVCLPNFASGPVSAGEETSSLAMACNVPIAGPANDLYMTSLTQDRSTSVLQKWQAINIEESTVTNGTVEEWQLGADASGNVYSAGVDGTFTKREPSGTLDWSTNYGSPVVALQVGPAGQIVISLQNGSVAELASPTAPHLSMTIVGSTITLTYPADKTNLVIATSSDLTGWTPMTNNLSTNGQYVITNSTVSQQFFRLQPK
jgi:hypothetical protein